VSDATVKMQLTAHSKKLSMQNNYSIRWIKLVLFNRQLYEKLIIFVHPDISGLGWRKQPDSRYPV